jgi:hypothetical protein
MPHKFEGDPAPAKTTELSQSTQDELSAEKKLEVFIARNKEFFALYANDSSISVKPSRELGTFAIDLEEGVIYGDPSYYEKKGMTEAHAFNSFLHEFEHFRRLMTLTCESDGLEVWGEHRKRVKTKPHLHVLDNVLEDISVDRAILSRAPNQRETQFDLYRSNLWPSTDNSKLPAHLQFIYTLFREQMMPEEPVEVTGKVRDEIERLRGIKNAAGQGLIDVMTDPDLSQAKRLALQKKFFEPVYERFFEEDVKEKKDQEEKKQKEQGGEGSSGQSSGGEKGEQNKEAEPGKPEGGQGKPDDLFQGLYDEYFEKSPDAVFTEGQIEEALKKVIEAKQGKPKSAEDLALEAYAKEVGVNPSDLKEYQKFWEDIEEMHANDADETVVEGIRVTFRKILTERLEPVMRSRQPVEEGEYLVRPAEAVAEVLAGHTQPRVWMTRERKEYPKEIFGAFDITVVCDRSVSMNESDGSAVKQVEQQKAVMLLLEAMREFCDDLDDKRKDLTADLQVRSEVWGFGGPEEVGCIKALSDELTDIQRVAVYKELKSTPGRSTRDDLALKGIFDSIPEEDFELIERGKLQKVIIVLTDGNSSNAEGTKKAIKDLRDKGVVVVAIGITKAGKEAIRLYKPDAHLAKTAADTGIAVGKVLKEFLKGLNG